MVKAKSILRLVTIVALLATQNCAPGSRLLVRIAPPPKKAFKLASQDFLKQSKAGPKDKLPTNLSKRPTPGGIQVRYAGYRRYTGRDGKASFPLTHSAKKVSVIVTSKVFPRILSGNTVDHFALWEGKKPAEVDAQMFEMTKEKVGEKEWTWTVEERKALPEDGKISNTAVIIQADPKSVFVPVGKSKGLDKKHHALPQIFLLDRDGIDEMILAGLGKKEIKTPDKAKYNFFENLKERIKHEDRDGKKIKISNLPEGGV